MKPTAPSTASRGTPPGGLARAALGPPGYVHPGALEAGRARSPSPMRPPPPVPGQRARPPPIVSPAAAGYNRGAAAQPLLPPHPHPAAAKAKSPPRSASPPQQRHQPFAPPAATSSTPPRARSPSPTPSGMSERSSTRAPVGRPGPAYPAHPAHPAHPATPSVAHPATPSVAHPAAPSVAHPATPSVAHPATPSVATPAATPSAAARPAAGAPAADGHGSEVHLTHSKTMPIGTGRRPGPGLTGAAQETPPLFLPAEQPPLSRLDRVFLKHHSVYFADRAEFVFRTMFCMFFMALPLIMPDGTFPTVEAHMKDGNFGKLTPLMFILVVDITLGQTMSNAAGAILGSALSVGSGMLLQWASSIVSSSAGLLVVIPAVVYSTAFLWLLVWINFSMQTRIFSIYSFSYYFMDFLHPNNPMCAISTTTLCAPSTGLLVQTAVACGLAIVCSLLPRPMLALNKAKADTQEMSDALGRAWMEFGALFCGSYSADYTPDRLAANLRKLRALRPNVEAGIKNSYWEFGWLLSMRSQRQHLSRLEITLQESSDRLFYLWNTVLQESYPGMHQELMRHMWPSVHTVLLEGSRILDLCTPIGASGKILADEETMIREAVERMQAAIKKMTTTFRQQKSSVTKVGIRQELIDEHSFLLHVSAYGRIVSELGLDYLTNRSGVRPLPSAPRPQSLFDKEVLSDKKHMAFAVRGFAIVAISFAVGCFSHSKLLVEYDGGIAAVSALLLRKSVGSQNAQNLQRLRGVAIGSMAGHAAYAMVGWCSWWSYIATVGMISCWVGASLFQHHDGSVAAGASIGHITGGASGGLLSAYFGARGMMEQCSNQVYSVTDFLGPSYYKVINSLLAVFICFAVDWLLSPPTAAQLATETFGDAWRGLSQAITDAIDPSVLEMHQHSVISMHSLRVAKAVGQQAEKEPRYWREPWRGSVFNDSVEAAQRLRMSLCGLEYCVADGGRFGAGKAEKARKLTSLQSFTKLSIVVEQALDQIEHALEGVLMQETGATLKFFSDIHVKRQFLSEFVNAMLGFLREANALPEVSHDRDPPDSLEEDSAALASALLSGLASIVAEAQTLPRAIAQRSIF